MLQVDFGDAITEWIDVASLQPVEMEQWSTLRLHRGMCSREYPEPTPLIHMKVLSTPLGTIDPTADAGVLVGPMRTAAAATLDTLVWRPGEGTTSIGRTAVLRAT